MQKYNKSKLITIRLREDTYHDILNLADKNKRKNSEMIRIILEEYINFTKKTNMYFANNCTQNKYKKNTKGGEKYGL